MHFRFLHIDDDRSALRNNEVHVWTAPLDRAVAPSLLVDAERERAARLKLERVRNQFIAARTHLRIVLGRYLELPPAEVPLAYELNGKPVLANENKHALHFNISHSEALAVVAVTLAARIGIDIERRRPISNLEGLVERFFAQGERDCFFALPNGERLDAFFRAWTRKEAVLKAIGEGVQALDQYEVTFADGERVAVTRIRDDASAGLKWLLKTWQPAPGYEGAIAVERQT